MKFKSIFRNLDLLSPKIGFEYDGCSNYKSYFGSLYSLIFILSTTSVTLLFGQDFYLRSNPSVSTSQVINETSSLMFNSNETFTVYAFLENAALSDNVLSKYEIDLVSYAVLKAPNGTVTTSRTVMPSPLVKCNTLNLTLNPQIEKIFSFKDSVGFYCMKYLNLVFENGFSEIPSSYLNLRLSRCIGCPHTSVLGDFFSVAMVDSFNDHSNYTNPIQYKLNSQTYQINDGLLKRYYFRLTKNTYISDNGWILGDLVNYEYIALKDIANDIVLTAPNPSYSYPLLWLTFESPRLSLYTVRMYLKIQDFCANAGGFINAYFIIIDVLTKGHLRFVYLLFLRNLALETERDHLKMNHFKVPQINQLNNSSQIELNNNDVRRVADRNSSQISKGLVNLTQNNIQELNIQTIAVDNGKNHVKIQADTGIGTRTIAAVNNNFLSKKINRKDTILKHLSILETRESYLLYLWYFVSCSRNKYLLYKKQFSNIEKLISISAFSKIMTYQFEESGE